MPATRPGATLFGRRSECAVLDRLIDEARAGRSSVLVLRGEPGVGKTALLEYAVHSATGLRVAHLAGVESEMELAFAALQQLCAPLLDRLDLLPAPQSGALKVAVGLSDGDTPDRFLVALAALSLLSVVAEEKPLLCVVDDAQWLDQASADVFGFIGRRLLAESLALVFATRDPNENFRGLPERLVGGLRDAAARELLNSVTRGQIDVQVRERIIAETRGNPLALLELPRELTPARLAGGFGLVDTPDLSGRIEKSFRRRYETLPPDARRLLLVAAAEPVGDPVLLWRAVALLGISAASAVAAESSGLLEISTRVVFRHPLVRSAIYSAALPEERRVVHQVLAEVTNPGSDPDRRAWHRAHATVGPDEDVAHELERSAGRAQSRGGIAAAAAFLERSSELTLDPARRAERSLAAAQAKQRIGEFDVALSLVAVAESGPADHMRAARADLLRGQIAFALNFGSDASPLLLKAAQQLESLDAQLANDAYLEAMFTALIAGRLARGADVQEVAARAGAAALPSKPAPSDLLLKGFGSLVMNGFDAAAPVLGAAVRGLRYSGTSGNDELRLLWLAGHAAGLLWDFEAWDDLSARLVQIGRSGALMLLPMGLSTRAGALLFAGEFAEAEALAEEEAAISEVTGSRIAPYGPLCLAAFRGREAEAFALVEATTNDASRRGEGVALTFAQWAAAVLCNGLGRYQEASVWAEQASADSDLQRFTNWALVELIEAKTRTGRTEEAAAAFDRLSTSTRASGTDWAVGTESCARALLDGGESAEVHYREAVDRLGRTRLRVAFARANLLYGEWLRRQRRRLEARQRLRFAYERFSELGMEAFAERSRVELEATGEHARKRDAARTTDLTPQEARISRLAAEGASNAEIATRLYISAKTVDYHLHKVFLKLGVKSRGQLAHQLHIGAQTLPA